MVFARALSAITGLLACASASSASAQVWPSKPIRLVVPYVAGGGVDSFARVIGGKMEELFKTPIVIDNRGGAGGNVGANIVAKAAPDGYTWLINTNGQAISPVIFKSLPYDSIKELARVAELAATSTVLVINKDLPVKDFREFVAYAKAHPGKINYGSSGVGNNLHLTMERLKRAAGFEAQMVPFGGDAPLYTALIGGDIQAGLVPTTASRPLIEAGTIRALGVTTATRVSTMPNIPTIREQGMPDFSASGYVALFVTAGAPREIIQRIADTARKALETPELKDALVKLTLDPGFAGPDEFDKIYLDDVARFRQIVKDANIPLQD